MERYAKLAGWYVNLGFWVTLVYRFGSWASNLQPRVLGIPFLFFHWLLAVPIRVLLQVHLPSKTIIGPGLRLPHPYLILIPPETVLGRNCTIYHDVTLGHGSIPGVPRLANDVVVFPGARILGGVRVGDQAHLGANTVVMRDIDPEVSVTVPLARLIQKSMAKALRKSP